MEKLYRDRDMVVAARTHPLLRKTPVSLDDLARSPWAISNKYLDLLRHIQKVFASEGITGPRVSVRTDSTSLTMALILRAGHVSLLSEELLENAEHLSGIRTLRSTEFERARTGFLFYRRRSRMNAAASVLAEHVRAVCASIYGPMSD